MKPHSKTVIVWTYKNADCSLKINILSFIIFFGTLSFAIRQLFWCYQNIICNFNIMIWHCWVWQSSCWKTCSCKNWKLYCSDVMRVQSKLPAARSNHTIRYVNICQKRNSHHQLRHHFHQIPPYFVIFTNQYKTIYMPNFASTNSYLHFAVIYVDLSSKIPFIYSMNVFFVMDGRINLRIRGSADSACDLLRASRDCLFIFNT